MSTVFRIRTARRWTLPTTLAILLVGGALSTSILTACLQRGPQDTPSGGGGGAAAAPGLPPNLFQGWPAGKKPDVAFILSGQQHSYLKFCGCSTPQLGGFERRYNFMKKLEAMGWPLVGADLGDLVQFTTGIHDQSLLKYETAMKALEILDYSAIGLGADDFALPLIDGMARFSLQRPNAFPRVLAANLDATYRAQNFPNPGNGPPSMIGDWLPVRKKGVPAVGIASLIGKAEMKKIQAINQNVKFAANNADVLTAILDQMNKEKVELRILLFQGSILDAPNVAKQFPSFDIILCHSDEDTPPAQAQFIGKTMIARVGHKGKFIGVVGAFRTGEANKPFELHYQSVAIGEDFETPKGKEAGHPVLKLLDWYADEVKKQEFLLKVPQRPYPPAGVLNGMNLPEPPKFVGSGACLNCHQADAAVWQKSGHSHAYKALSAVATKPAQRQYDPECIKCHVVGFGHTGGFVSNPKTPNLKDVGCENCHGPGSLHVAAPKNAQFQLAMSPWKGNDPNDRLPPLDVLQKGFNAMNPQQRALVNRINSDMCQKCHDPENDPHFKFETFWPKVMHGKFAPAPAAKRN